MPIDPLFMTPGQVTAARKQLGHQWGLGRQLRYAEFGRALRLQGRDPGQSVALWETGKSPVTGPVSLLIEAFLAGFKPAELRSIIAKKRPT